MNRRSPASVAFVFTLLGTASAMNACSSAPEQSPDRATAGQSNEAPSTDSLTLRTQVARQTVEVEPGHTVTLTRFADGSLTIAEVGEIGRHTPAIERRAVGRSVSAILHLAAPNAVLDPALLDESTLPVPAAAQPLVAPSPPAAEAVSVASKLLPLNLPSTYLNCANASDIPPSNCYGALASGMALNPELGGWYRAYGVNQGTSGAATLTIYNYISSDYSYQPYESVSLGAGQWGQLQALQTTPVWSYASITQTSGAPSVGISSFVSSISPRAQLLVNACWATASQMVMASYGTALSQCTIESTHFGQNCCAQPLPASSICGSVGPSGQGEGEAWQALHENGFAFTELGAAVDDPLALGAALQNGPMTVHQTQHYTVLADYREISLNGKMVPYALKVDPEPENDTTTMDHVTWLPVSSVGVTEGGYADDAQADVHSSLRPNLAVAIPRISWKSATGVVTGIFDAPGATSYNVEWSDLNNNVYGSQTIAVASNAMPGAAAEATANFGAWMWYRLHVQACGGGTCGAWTTKDAVSLLPSTTVNTLTASNGTLSATFTGNPWPERYNYQCISTSAGATPVHYGHVVPVFAAETAPGATSASCVVGTGTQGTFMVQACNDNGCGPWATATTGT